MARGPASALQDVTIPVGESGSVPSALALPPLPGPRPGVIVLHEMLGLNDDIRSIAARLAGHGYVAVAPDFLAGLGPKPLCMARFFRGLNQVGKGGPYRRLEAVRVWLAARPDVDPSKIAIAGFCIGGGFALLYAASRGRGELAAIAPFYAGVPRDPASALEGICPVVAAYGGRDRIFGSHGKRLDAALDELGVDHEVRTYPDAGHSFMNRHGPLLTAIERRLPMHGGFHAQSAEDAWRRLLRFFDERFAATGAPG